MRIRSSARNPHLRGSRASNDRQASQRGGSRFAGAARSAGQETHPVENADLLCLCNAATRNSFVFAWINLGAVSNSWQGDSAQGILDGLLNDRLGRHEDETVVFEFAFDVEEKR